MTIAGSTLSFLVMLPRDTNTYAVADRKGSGVSCGPRFLVCWWGRVMTALLHLISQTVNSHNIIYLWKPRSWTHNAMGGQIITTAALLYHSHFKETTIEWATNWADMKYGPLPNTHNIAGQSNINNTGIFLYVKCVCGIAELIGAPSNSWEPEMDGTIGAWLKLKWAN